MNNVCLHRYIVAYKYTCKYTYTYTYTYTFPAEVGTDGHLCLRELAGPLRTVVLVLDGDRAKDNVPRTRLECYCRVPISAPI